jgi:hypothetical protein
VVSVLPKTKDPRVHELLLELLDHPDVAAFAAEVLGKLRFAGARDRPEKRTESPDPNVRVQAHKARKRLAAASQ